MPNEEHPRSWPSASRYFGTDLPHEIKPLSSISRGEHRLHWFGEAVLRSRRCPRCSSHLAAIGKFGTAILFLGQKLGGCTRIFIRRTHDARRNTIFVDEPQTMNLSVYYLQLWRSGIRLWYWENSDIKIPFYATQVVASRWYNMAVIKTKQ